MNRGRVTEKTMYSELLSEAHIQVYAEFPWSLLSYDNRYGGFKIVVAFTRTTYKNCNKFYQKITPTMYSCLEEG